MKVRISPTGNLEIFRSYEYKVQTCCYHQFKYCGDHCPHFSEPHKSYANNNMWKICIYICNNREINISDSDFEDLRVKQETEYDYKFESLNDDGSLWGDGDDV